MAYRPRELVEKLHVAPSTLRLWSTEFEAFLSESARTPRTGAGRHARRAYTDGDLALLARVSALFEQGGGRTYAEIRRRRRAELAGAALASTGATGRATADPSELKRRLASLEARVTAQDGTLRDLREEGEMLTDCLIDLEDRCRSLATDREAARRDGAAELAGLRTTVGRLNERLERLERRVRRLERTFARIEVHLRPVEERPAPPAPWWKRALNPR